MDDEHNKLLKEYAETYEEAYSKINTKPKDFIEGLITKLITTRIIMNMLHILPYQNY